MFFFLLILRRAYYETSRHSFLLLRVVGRRLVVGRDTDEKAGSVIYLVFLDEEEKNKIPKLKTVIAHLGRTKPRKQ